MARIRASDTEPELAVRRALHAMSLRFRVQFKTAGGRADIALTRRRLAVFVDGCFWHGCPEHYVRPRTRNEFWDAKLRENVDRDRRSLLKLKEAGWIGLRVWEHEVAEAPERVVALILKALKSGRAPRRDDWRVVRVETIDAERDLERRFCERLSDASKTRVEERVRSTRKLGRVSGMVLGMKP